MLNLQCACCRRLNRLPGTDGDASVAADTAFRVDKISPKIHLVDLYRVSDNSARIVMSCGALCSSFCVPVRVITALST